MATIPQLKKNTVVDEESHRNLNGETLSFHFYFISSNKLPTSKNQSTDVRRVKKKRGNTESKQIKYLSHVEEGNKEI